MGMYTELVLSARIDLSDKDFLSDLEYMVEGNDDLSKSYQNKTQHRLFQISNRWHYMLRSDSSYFSGTTHSDIFKNEDSFSPAWYLTVRCNLKNYDGEIEAFLDSAVLANLDEVRIVHGMGTGKLRAGIHEYLRKERNVAEFRLGRYGEGDTGVTIVTLK